MRKLMLLRKSIVYKWAISYMVVLVFIIVIMSVSYKMLDGVIKNIIQEFNNYTIAQIAEQINVMLYDMNRISSQVVFDINLQQALNVNNSDTERQYAMYLLQKDLFNYQYDNKNISQSFIYIHDLDTVVYKNGISSSLSYYQGYAQNLEMTYEEWIDQIKKDTLTVFDTQKEKDGGLTLILRTSLPIGGINKRSASFFVVSDSHSLITAIHQINSDINYFLVNNQGKALFGTNIQLTKGIEALQIDESQNNHVVNVDDNKYLLTYKESNIQGINLCLITPYDKYWEKLKFARSVVYLGIFIIIIGGIVLIWLLIRRNYKPIHKILEFIYGSSERTWDQKQIEDEYKYISNTIQTLVHENKRILINDFFMRLLNGKVNSNTTIERLFDQFGIKLLSDRFRVAIVVPCVDVVMDAQATASSDSYHNSESIFETVFTEMVSNSFKDGQGYVISREEEIVCIFNYKVEEESTIDATIAELLHKTVEVLRIHSFVYYETVLSTTFAGVKGINLAYLQAASMLNQRKVMEDVNSNSKLEESTRFSDAHQEMKASQITILVSRVAEYIELNYLDVNLDMTAIGDYFKMDGRQLSKVYKAHSGERIIDHLNKVRIAKFKVLAAMGNMTLADAAEQSGFTNYRTFMRIFKKYEGTTPGQFKDEELGI